MKKLMIAAAVVAMAVASQAATMTWSLASIVGDANSGAAAAGWTVQLYASDGFSLEKVIAGTLTADYETVTQDKSGTIYAQSTGNNKPDGKTPYESPYAIGDTASYYAVIWNNADVDKATYVIASDLREATVASDGKNITLAYGKMSETTATKNAFLGQTWTAVAPEPTSGMLLLLGMGALALRRRRA